MIKRGIGTRFEKAYERLSVAVRVELYIYEALFGAFCFAPVVYLALREG